MIHAGIFGLNPECDPYKIIIIPFHIKLVLYLNQIIHVTLMKNDLLIVMEFVTDYRLLSIGWIQPDDSLGSVCDLLLSVLKGSVILSKQITGNTMNSLLVTTEENYSRKITPSISSGVLVWQNIWLTFWISVSSEHLVKCKYSCADAILKQQRFFSPFTSITYFDMSINNDYSISKCYHFLFILR